MMSAIEVVRACRVHGSRRLRRRADRLAASMTYRTGLIERRDKLERQANSGDLSAVSRLGSLERHIRDVERDLIRLHALAMSELEAVAERDAA